MPTRTTRCAARSAGHFCIGLCTTARPSAFRTGHLSTSQRSSRRRTCSSARRLRGMRSSTTCRSTTSTLGLDRLIRVNATASTYRLGVAGGLVGEESDPAADGLVFDEVHSFHVAGRTEEPLAGPEHDRVDHQPQFVDEVVVYQHPHELNA